MTFEGLGEMFEGDSADMYIAHVDGGAERRFQYWLPASLHFLSALSESLILAMSGILLRMPST